MSAVDEAIARWRENIPEELWTLPVWLAWIKRPKPNKPGKFDKIPFYTSGRQRHGANGSSADRAQLVEFGDAILAYRDGNYAGIGAAVLPDVAYWPLDLDGCIGANGALSPLAQRVVDSGAYVERSPSGLGLRALFAGKAGLSAKNHAAGVETFNDSGFVTITGDRIAGDDALVPCPAPLLEEILATVRAGGKRGGSPVARTDAPNVENVDLRTVRLPLSTWKRLAHPYQPGADRSAAAYGIAGELAEAGLTPEQALGLMGRPDCDVLAPALERRGGDIQSARAWLWKYCVLPAFEDRRAHGR
ncbi:MAG: hypothetical protein M0038_19775 [Pseudomonadota bacterium]|jgi:hypothetical protein|nr:hypothetical protein [Pseudomonadota bacterium]